jgi:hypothetical protein
MKQLIALISLVSIVGWGNALASSHHGGMDCSVAATGCTKDKNVCGNSSDCECKKGFEYNQATGTCDSVFPPIQKPVIATETVGASPYKFLCSFAPPSVCTMDINKCGNPSLCICPLFYVYNPATGSCDVAFPVKPIPAN